MHKRLLTVMFRCLFGVLGLMAIAVQFLDLAGSGTLNPVNFLSYFTIESNLIGAVVLLIGTVRWRLDRSPTLDVVRGGALVYLTITGLVFAVLLSGTDVDTAIPWVNTVVHQILPVVVLIDWLVDPPATRLTIRHGLLWLSYPLVWITYVLARGAIVGWYPYPFLNPTTAVGMALLCALALAVGNGARAKRRSPLGPT